jgi:hypothetical protein
MNMAVDQSNEYPQLDRSWNLLVPEIGEKSIVWYQCKPNAFEGAVFLEKG